MLLDDVEAAIPLVTPKFDIFQLGQLLWFLAQSWASGESIQSLKEHFLMPSDSVALAELVPTYYKDIVDACRAEDPLDRPSAAKLLSLLPSGTSETEFQGGQDAKPISIDVDTMWKCHPWSNFCDHCGKIISGLIFHCNLCRAGNYDACLGCFKAGFHCLDQTHLLVEVRSEGNIPIGKRYHSSVGSSGLRVVTEE
ncbi:uncharacterized protein BDZ99DRAFT_151889 [Mytilinidion resinicola]|uniref:ZZ-type domain-containing protein n=1 Tax=Mytilinidion resinicola TaxID=574789 RepID=A0A6A6Y6Z9_9PEZI|nr:uncharacterized protein BDZ99DRAFT_151889 [Mytilinidion resinicola]KAF2804369.1 hypothetical protein BDZ99DRAFT_151889 [Mytilinidion resinicola]